MIPKSSNLVYGNDRRISYFVVFRSKGQMSRSQGHRSSGRREFAPLSSVYRLVCFLVFYFVFDIFVVVNVVVVVDVRFYSVYVSLILSHLSVVYDNADQWLTCYTLRHVTLQ